jgi:hypothetical protein
VPNSSNTITGRKIRAFIAFTVSKLFEMVYFIRDIIKFSDCHAEPERIGGEASEVAELTPPPDASSRSLS